MGNPSAEGGWLNDLGMDQDTGELLTGEWASKDVHDTLDSIWDDRDKKERDRKAEQARYDLSERNSMKDYWESFQTWGADAKTDFDRSSGQMKSRMAAGGIKAGSEQWRTNLDSIKGDYDTTLTGFKEGATGTALSGWADKMQEDSDEKLSMEDYLGKEFGKKGFASDRGKTEADKAADSARQSAAGTDLRSKQKTTESPWW